MKKFKILLGGSIGNLSLRLLITDTKMRESCVDPSQPVKAHMNYKLKSHTANTLIVGISFHPP